MHVHTIYLNDTVKCAGVIIAPFYRSCTVIPTLPVGHICEPIYVKCWTHRHRQFDVQRLVFPKGSDGSTFHLGWLGFRTFPII